MEGKSILKSMRKRHNLLTIVILGLILAFVFAVLVYVGGALLQTINFTHIPEPGSAIEGGLLGAIIGIVGSLVARNKDHREP
jgi:small neutral amino acid transporter SnatA (MarC family)